MSKVLEKLPQAVRERLLQGGPNAFANVSKEMIKSIPASVYVAAGRDAIRSLDREQLKELTMNINKGTNSRDLEEILRDVDENQFENMLEDFQNSTQKLSKKQMEAFTRQMKAKNGNPSTWTAATVKQLGKMVKGLSPKELKELANAGASTFEASLEEIAKEEVEELSKGQRREIVNGAIKSFGSQDRWNASTVKKMSKFVGSMKHKDIERIPATAIKGAVADLATTEMDEKSSRELMKKLKDPTNGYGTPDSWSSETLRTMGNLSTGMTLKDIKELDKNAVKGALKTLGKAQLSTKQARKMASKMKEALGSPDTWSAETIKNASNILRGLKPKDLRSLPAEAVKNSLEDLKKIKFSRDQGRELAKKIKQTLGSPSSWNESVAEEMGPLVGGLPLTDLKNMSNTVMKSVLKSLKQDDSIPPSKKRAIIKKAKAAGNFKLLEAGSFLKTFTLNDLENVDPIKDLGLNDTTQANSTDDTDREMLPWKLSQARKVLEKIKAIWGEPDDEISDWTLENIVRLKGLAIGVWKGLIDKMPEHDIADIVEEFSQRDGFTPGQVKMILRAYKEKLLLGTPSNFSSLGEIEVDALGRFVIELDDADLENLSNESGIQAVRQMGELELNQMPRGLIERKLRISLKLIARIHGLQELVPSDLTAQDLEDLGNLALGFSPGELANLRADILRSAIHTLGQIEGFDREQLSALATKVKEAYKANGTVADAPSLLTDDDVHDIANILAGFTREDFIRMNKDRVQDHIDFLGSLPLDREQAEGLMIRATAARRKRRATDLSSKTGDELISMGAALLALTTSDIATVNTTSFEDAVYTIGGIQGFSREQLQAWAAKAKQAWSSSVSSFTSDQLLKLGAIAIGFNHTEIGEMMLSSNDVIESLGSQPANATAIVGYTSEQLLSALTRIKTLKGKEISAFTGEEIAALKNFALAMTPEEMANMTNEAFGVAVSTLGALNGWSVDQMVKLKEKSIGLYGPLTNWTAAELRESGAAIGGFTAQELQSLSNESLSMVSPAAIAAMPASLFAEFTIDQLKMFDSSQAAAVTTAQRNLLSPEKQEALAETLPVPTSSGSTTTTTTPSTTTTIASTTTLTGMTSNSTIIVLVSGTGNIQTSYYISVMVSTLCSVIFFINV